MAYLLAQYPSASLPLLLPWLELAEPRLKGLCLLEGTLSLHTFLLDLLPSARVV